MKYTIYRYKPDGMNHGWQEELSDTIPEGAVSVEVWDHWAADKTLVYALENAKGGE